MKKSDKSTKLAKSASNPFVSLRSRTITCLDKEQMFEVRGGAHSNGGGGGSSFVCHITGVR